MLDASDGSAVTLGAVLARAGEGTIHEVVGRPGVVAKIFHPDLKDLPAKRAKVAAMAASTPDGSVQSDGFVVLTWPLQTVEGDGTTGYLMSRIDTSNAVEIHSVSNPTDRMNPLPSAPQWTPHVTWQHLVSVAANLCLAVETVHKVDAVIGDFQERNILVNDTTRVTLVDCDSMQFTNKAGHQFLCGVGRPEFTAPELAGFDLAATARQKPSDLFALAVHIHLLLMGGNHPFQRGQWTGPGDQPDALTLAKTGQWAGGPGSTFHSHPLAPSISFLPDQIQTLFVRAFTHGAHTPDIRPTAAEWRQALHLIRIGNCPRGHQIPIEAPHCPWCTIDDERAIRRSRRTESQNAQNVHLVGPPGSTAKPKAATSFSGYGTKQSKPQSGRLLAMAAAGCVALIALIGTIVVVSSDNGTSSAIITSWPEATRDFDRPQSGSYATPSNTARASTSTQPRRPDASRVALNVSRPITQPACDGMGIVVLANATTPGKYEQEIQRALDLHPDATYLRTDHSCPSLRQSFDDGSPIYAVYRVAGRTLGEICAAVRRTGGNAYGKWLDTTTDPSSLIRC